MMRGRKTSYPASTYSAIRHHHERKEAHNVVERNASPQTGKGLFRRAVCRTPGGTALELSDAQGRQFGRERTALPQQARRGLVLFQACRCRSPQATLDCGGLTPLSRSPWVPSALCASAKRPAVLRTAPRPLHTTAAATHKQTLEATLISLQVLGSRLRAKARERDQEAKLRHGAAATSYNDADGHAIRGICVRFLKGG